LQVRQRGIGLGPAQVHFERNASSPSTIIGAQEIGWRRCAPFGSLSPRSTRQSATSTATSPAFRAAIARAEALGAELVAFPEQTIPGYPAEDLLLKAEFIEANRRALEALAKDVEHSVVVVGFADRQDDVFNAAAVIEGGQVRGVYRKHHLPNYSVFDEKRYFQAGNEPLVFGYGPITFGVNVCEDMWYPDGPRSSRRARAGPSS
jgi:predicted amidohydrolase